MDNWDTELRECVYCPVCAFGFDADHSDPDGNYSCPACAEVRLRQAFGELSRLEWIEEVDVNGEYTTTKWRHGQQMKEEVAKIIKSAVG